MATEEEQNIALSQQQEFSTCFFNRQMLEAFIEAGLVSKMSVWAGKSQGGVDLLETVYVLHLNQILQVTANRIQNLESQVQILMQRITNMNNPGTIN